MQGGASQGRDALASSLRVWSWTSTVPYAHSMQGTLLGPAFKLFRLPASQGHLLSTQSSLPLFLRHLMASRFPRSAMPFYPPGTCSHYPLHLQACPPPLPSKLLLIHQNPDQSKISFSLRSVVNLHVETQQVFCLIDKSAKFQCARNQPPYLYKKISLNLHVSMYQSVNGTYYCIGDGRVIATFSFIFFLFICIFIFYNKRGLLV